MDSLIIPKKGYAPKILVYHDLIKNNRDNPYRSTLGETGLAISTNCKHEEIAVEL
jgi:multiple sugar transport system substrate-binding protein